MYMAMYLLIVYMRFPVMKIYTKPEIEVNEFTVEDVITVSGDQGYLIQ